LSRPEELKTGGLPAPNQRCYVHRCDGRIVISKLSKRRCGRPVLDGVELELQAGEALGLMGSNGAGKTTLIKCLLDFIRADAGEIGIFGDSSHSPAARRHLAYLPERFQLPYHQTGREFLQMMMRFHEIRCQDRSVNAQLESLDLDPRCLEQRARTYSKGMAQKIGLAACLMSNKPLIVLDEPMSGLDPKARLCFKGRLAEEKAKGRTLLFTTHMPGDVEPLCDRLGILVDGRLSYFGSPAAWREKYAATSLEGAYLDCIGETTGISRHVA
jgi:ABC-2 type transport system ATP-binding protein